MCISRCSKLFRYFEFTCWSWKKSKNCVGIFVKGERLEDSGIQLFPCMLIFSCGTSRYIACLRGKLHSENLLRTEGEGGAIDGDEGGYESNCSNGSGSHSFSLDAMPSYNARRVERYLVQRQTRERYANFGYRQQRSSLQLSSQSSILRPIIAVVV